MNFLYMQQCNFSVEGVFFMVAVEVLLWKIRESDEFHTWHKILGDVPNFQIGEREKFAELNPT